jgi:hypothetical protein
MGKEITEKESTDKLRMECAAPGGQTWDKIGDEAFQLSHLVQAGRRVSKEELLEVDRHIKGPYGFSRK